MNKPDSFVEFIKDQFDGLRDFTMRRMFGAYGLYLGDAFFGILDDGELYFKTSDATVAQYQSAGSEPFFYYKKDKSGKKKKCFLKNYYGVPLDILENQNELKRWAKEAALK